MNLNFRKLSLCCLFASSTAIAANSSYQAPLVKESLLLDIEKSEMIYIVGERGHILIGDPQSEIKQVSVPTKTTLTAISLSGKNAWVVGHDASILHSANNGQTWEMQLTMPELDRPFLDVLFFDDTSGVAVGAYGLFYRTNDAGNTWTRELHASVLPQDDIDYLDSIKDDTAFYEDELSFILPHFNRLSYSDGKLYMAGEAGMLAISEDKGQSWRRVDINYRGSFFDVKTTSEGDLVAVGLRGNIFAKKKNESNWQAIQTCITTSLNSIVNNNTDNIFITGNNGVVLSLNKAKLFSNEFNAMNDEGCAMHASVKKLANNLSDSILNGLIINDAMLAVTASGLKQIELK